LNWFTAHAPIRLKLLIAFGANAAVVEETSVAARNPHAEVRARAGQAMRAAALH
jgi:hypothetical protein